MELGKKQYLIKIEKGKGVIFRKGYDAVLRSYLVIINDQADGKIMYSSKEDSQNVIEEEPYLVVIGSKKQIIHITTKKFRNGEAPFKMKGTLTLIYADEENLGLFMIQAKYCEEKDCYESVQTYIDLIDKEQTMYLANCILKACTISENKEFLLNQETVKRLF